jgi:hypothetical protein
VAIPIDNLNKNFVVVGPDTTQAELQALLAKHNDWTFVVITISNGIYAVLRGPEIVKALQDPFHVGASPLGIPLSQQLQRFGRPALDQGNIGWTEAQRLVKASPGKRLAVTLNEEVIGVLSIETRSLRVDSDWVANVANAPTPASGGFVPPQPTPPQPTPPSPKPPSPTPSLSLTRGRKKDETSPISEEPKQQRWINAEILDKEPDTPIKIGEICTLAFDVDTKQRAGSLVKNAVLGYVFGKEEESVDLTVQLSSDDFIIHTKEAQTLKVPRTGKSKNRARFDIEPKHDGPSVINAVFLKDGNFVQLLTISMNVGGPQKLKSESLSRPLDSAFDIQPRDVTLVITNTGTAFKLILTGSVYAEATIPLTLPELDYIIDQVRSALKDVVNFTFGPKKIRAYQESIKIAPEVNEAALKHLAKAGYLLFQQIFYGDAADAQSKRLGDKLIAMSERQRLKLQIVSQQFLLPWGLMYLAAVFDPDKIDPERFLGFRHIIEHIPLQQDMQTVDAVINSQPNLTVSLNVNRGIDQQMGVPLIAEQLD